MAIDILGICVTLGLLITVGVMMVFVEKMVANRKK